MQTSVNSGAQFEGATTATSPKKSTQSHKPTPSLADGSTPGDPEGSLPGGAEEPALTEYSSTATTLQADPGNLEHSIEAEGQHRGKTRITRVLVVCPNKLDRAGCAKAISSNGGNSLFEFHYFDDCLQSPLTFGHQLIKFTQLTDSEFQTYVEKAVDYVRDKKIEAVITSGDTGSLLAAAVCAETGLRGPSFESVFLCWHKYYSRRAEPTKLWCEYIPLDEEAPQDQHAKVKYPCFLKPTSFSCSAGLFVVWSRTDLDKALETLRSITSITAYNNMWKPIFNKYLNLQKYPLATSNIVIIEELVEDAAQYCVEGWIDSNSEYYLWDIVDYQNYQHPPSAFFGYFTPTSESQEVIAKLTDVAATVTRNIKLKNALINVEIWRRGDRFDVIEVNGRCAATYHGLYRGVYNSSLYKAAAYVAMGEFDKVKKESPLAQFRPSCVGGQFFMYTLGEGKASEFLNYTLACSIGETEDIYDFNGDKGIEIPVDQDEWVTPKTSASGTCIASFLLFGPSREEISKRARNIISGLQLQPQLAPIL